MALYGIPPICSVCKVHIAQSQKLLAPFQVLLVLLACLLGAADTSQQPFCCLLSTPWWARPEHPALCNSITLSCLCCSAESHIFHCSSQHTLHMQQRGRRCRTRQAWQVHFRAPSL